MLDEPTITPDLEQQVEDQGHSKQPKRSWWRWSLGGRSTTNTTALLLKNRKTKHEVDDLAVTPHSALRFQALHLLFGLSPAHLTEWDGLLMFFHHIEAYFTQLLDPRFEFIWKLIGQDRPSDAVHVWTWCLFVINTFQSSKDADPSIEKIYQSILGTAKKRWGQQRTEYTPNNEQKGYILQAIFAVLCWTSGTLTPIIGKNGTQHRSPSQSDASDEEESALQSMTVLMAQNCSRIYSSSNLRRPASLMFHTYRLVDSNTIERGADVLNEHNSQAPTGSFEDMLYEPILTYDSLRMIGHVGITWVDTVTAHLSFDHATRKLSVYRYPSFFVTKIFAEQRIEVLESITEKLLPSRFDDSLHGPVSVYREALLTYRLLFGQSRKSRKILTEILDSPSNGMDINTALSGKAGDTNGVDGFLKTLCTTPLYTRRRILGLPIGKRSGLNIRGDLFPISALSVHDELIESNSYSARDDFPVFGLRLLALQRYNKRHQPSKITDLWRDRRNPLQWYTFWAVLIVGGLGILLALLQFIVGVVQMRYAINPAD